MSDTNSAPVKIQGTATIATVDGRYLLVEFQDYQGNVLYFHTDARATWLQDGTSVQAHLDDYELTESDLSDIFAS